MGEYDNYNEPNWSDCPIFVEGVISGSLYQEIF